MTEPLWSAAQEREFRAKLLAWFDLHKRDLPWRHTRDPYAIWVSEVMLQQTRVAAVLDHYARWMQKFPTVEALASAGEDEVLAAWSGLGYYRRARFLHKGAKSIASDHNGHLPQTAMELRTLPGIGAYTSAAIASIAFGEAAAAVDGNVERVLLRQQGAREAGNTKNAAENGDTAHALTAAEIQGLATKLIDCQRPGDFNQAMMELGATICLPRNPLCLQCPVQASCKTRGAHPTAERKPTRAVDIEYVVVQRKRRGRNEIFLNQRARTATVMAGMWELPQPVARRTGENPFPPRLTLRHAIMQTNYRVTIYESFQGSIASLRHSDGGSWINLTDLASLPLTGLARKALLRLGILAAMASAPITGILPPPK